MNSLLEDFIDRLTEEEKEKFGLTKENREEWINGLIEWLVENYPLTEEEVKRREESLRKSLALGDLEMSEETILRTQDRVEARIKRLATGETTLEQEEDELLKEFRARLAQVKNYKYANNLLNYPDVPQSIKDDFEREIIHIRIQKLTGNF